jgi:hypothetical protein
MHLVIFIVQGLSLSCGQVNVGAVTETDILDVLVLRPLGYDQDVHPAEEGEQEEDLRDELEEEVEAVAEMQAVHALQNDTQGHLDDCENNGKLHLEVVAEGEELIGLEPNGVETEGIHLGWIGYSWILAILSNEAEFSCVINDLNLFLIVRGSEDVHRDGEKLVVYQAAEHCEETHHYKDISHAE